MSASENLSIYLNHFKANVLTIEKRINWLAKRIVDWCLYQVDFAFKGISKKLLNLFVLTLFFPMFSFDPPENITKPLVFRCFQGDQKGTLGRKSLMVTSPTSLNFIIFCLLHSGWEKCGEDQNGMHNNQQKVEYVYVKQWPWCRTQKGRVSGAYLLVCQSSILDLFAKIVYR